MASSAAIISAFAANRPRRFAVLLPMTVGCAGANCSGHGLLVARLAAVKGGADFEQLQVALAARGIARCRCQQRRQHRGPQGVEVRGDGVGQLPRIVAAAEQFRPARGR